MLKNTQQVILSSIIILLPIIFGLIMWNNLPSTMTTHWNTVGAGNVFDSKPFVVCGIPLILLAVHLLCVSLTLLDKKQKNQNKKALGLIFWIVPVISLFINTTIYTTALGREIQIAQSNPALLGLLLVIIGNYLPKIKQNNTLGIKLPRTLQNEENWNKTHRFAGKIWVLGGLAIIFSIFLPVSSMIYTFLISLFVIIVVPIIYSYIIYKKHKKEGIIYISTVKTKKEKITNIIITIFVLVIILALGVVLFTGNITVDCTNTALQIKSNYWTDISVDYANIDSLIYREDFSVGFRSHGFGTPRLSMGTFQNEELGFYTLYAYTEAKEYILIKSGEKNLVIGLKNKEDTERVFKIIKDKLLLLQ